MDAFFAAIEERDRPYLAGAPFVVGADPKDGQGRGVVSTANYKARTYGVKSAMPISFAWRILQRAKEKGEKNPIFLRPNFLKYEKSSNNVYKILKKYSVVVEQASIDEFYFDLSEQKKFKKAKEIAKQIKKEIKKKEKLTASIGIGPNKLIAKIASDIQKPDGLTIIGCDNKKTCDKVVETFLDPLSISKIPGVGPKTQTFFNKKGIHLIKDLKKMPKTYLKDMLGKWGEDIHDKAHGKFDMPLSEETEIKSIGEQETFFKDTLDSNFILERLDSLCDGIFNRFQQSGFKEFRTVVITIRFSDFQTQTRSHTLKEFTFDKKTLKRESLKLILPFFDKRENPRKKLIRLIGVRIEKLK
jgi:DNA polymerase IV (DinB-like DNA polymerase)